MPDNAVKFSEVGWSSAATKGRASTSNPDAFISHGLDKWLCGINRSVQPSSEYLSLICFPFAGGGSSAFAPWRKRGGWQQNVEILALQYPGREARWGEPSFTSLGAFIDALAADLSPLWDADNFAFWGHSFGALIAFELTRRLSQSGRSLPRHLFLSGARAPHLPPRDPIHHLPSQAFLRELVSYGGMDEEILRNRDLLAAILPAIQDDFRIFEQYLFYESAPLPVPVSVFGGLADKYVAVEDVLGWSAHTSSTFRARFLEGDHFFPFHSVTQMSEYLAEDLQAIAPGNTLYANGRGTL